MPRIFISYSRADEPFARRLATSLSQMGADVWIDIEDIPVGMKWSSAVQQGLDTGDLIIVIISPDSMASHNVEDEWQYYLDNGKPVLPVLLKPAKIHFQLNRLQYIDFHRQNYDAALYQLYQELRRKGVYLNPIAPEPAAAYRPSPHQITPPTSRTTKRPRPIMPFLVAGVFGIMVLGIAAVVLLALLSPKGATANPTAAMATSPAATRAPTDPPANHIGLPGYPVTRNADWTPVTRDWNGISMALAPVGCFTMGSSEAQIDDALTMCQAVLGNNCNRRQFEDERPQTQVCFQQPFWIGRYEVTNAAYGSHGAFSGDNIPRTNVTWEQAEAFCESRGMRLPTEAEWEYAARGPDGLMFPWGNTFDGTRLNICDSNCDYNWRDSNVNDGYAQVAPVGSYPAGVSWVGAFDLSGNVWEWTSTIYTYPYPYNPNDGRENRAASGKRVLRGSSWNWIAADAATAARDDYAGDFSSSDWYGFRCARDYQPGDWSG